MVSGVDAEAWLADRLAKVGTPWRGRVFSEAEITEAYLAVTAQIVRMSRARAPLSGQIVRMSRARAPLPNSLRF